MKFLCACNLLYPVNTIRIPELLFSLFAFGVYCVFLRIGISKILFTYFLIIDYISAIQGISFMISRAIWSCPPQSWPDVLVCVTLYALTLPLLMVLFRKYGPTIYNPNTAPGLWRVIWLIPAANTLIILIFTNDFDPARANDPLSLIVRFLALVSSLVIFFLLLGSLKNWIRQSILEEQIQHGQQILALQRE